MVNTWDWGERMKGERAWESGSGRMVERSSARERGEGERRETE